MEHLRDDRTIGRISQHAFEHITTRQRETSNLYLEHRLIEAGEQLGPTFQKIVAAERSALVFADDDPQANFGHACRYLLFDPSTGRFKREVPARFPHYLTRPPETLKPIHRPVRFVSDTDRFRMRPIIRCPRLHPAGSRYAILYSGMSNMRHVNDLEFCYRMLVDQYGFAAANIYVCNYDGSLNSQDGVPTTWPGDGTPYRLAVTHAGNRGDFQRVLAALEGKLKSEDLLFIHTNNHGDNFGAGSFLCEYPSWGSYMAADFCSDLTTLPRYRSLLK